MKKFVALLLTAMLVIPAAFAFSVSASAPYEDTIIIDDEGNAEFENAYGYTFRIDDINGKIEGEDSTIITNANAYDVANPNWAISIELKKLSATQYEVLQVIPTPAAAGACDAATLGLTFADGNIVMIVHSASSRPTDAEVYPNWEQKTAAVALQPGDVLTFKGVDIDAGTVDNGTAYVEIPEDQEPEEPEEPAEPAEPTLVSQGVNYTVSGAGHGFTDTEGQWPAKYDANLTDGQTADEVDFGLESHWFGLYYKADDEENAHSTSPNGIGTITLDLGEVKNNVCKFRVHIGNDIAAGISSPKSVKVSTSADGTTYTEPVEFTDIQEAVEGVQGKFWIELTVDPADAQFVKFDFEHGKGVFIFLDEIEVYAGAAEDKPVDPEEPEEPEEPDTYEDDVKAAMGEKNADGKFDVVLTAPETYKAGDTVTVKATVNNVTYEKGLYLIEFHLVFDDAKLENTNVHNADNSLEIITKAPGNNAWENLTKANFTDGTIEVSVTNPNDISPEAGVKEDGSIEFTFTFKAKEDADGKIGVYVPHDSVHANDVDFNEVLGNGTYVIMDKEAEETEPSEEPSEDTSSEETSTPATSDNGINVLVFAIIALVAIAGTAVVIKSRN